MKHIHIILFVLTLSVLPLSAQEPIAVLTTSSTCVTCTNATTMTCTEQRVWRINDERGKKYANTVIQLDDNTQLTSFSMTIYDGNGNKLRKIKKDDLQKTEYSSHLASDAYYLYTDFTPPVYPVIVSMETEERFTGGFTSFPTFFPQQSREVEVKDSYYRLTIPASMTCRIAQKNTSLDVSQHTNEKGQKVYEVSATNIPAQRQESYTEKWSEQAPRIYFAPEHFEYLGTSGTLTTWQDYGKWQWNMIANQRSLPEAAKQRVHQLTDTCTTIRSKVSALYHLLGETTRYVSIQLGIGGLRPFPAEFVWKTGFGDCKALTNYMCALLEEAGVQAQYTIISTENQHVLPHFPAGNYFNHVICAVPQQSDTLWIECTNPTLPLGYVHEDIANHHAVMISPEGGTLVTLPNYSDSQNRQVSKADITLSADGSASISMRQRSYLKQYEDMLPVVHSNQQEQRNTLAHTLKIPGIHIQKMTIRDIKDDYAIPFTDTEATMTADSYATGSLQRLFVPICPFHQGYTSLNSKEPRTNDITVDYGYHDTDTITITIPEGYTIEAMPSNTDIQSDFGTFTSTITLHDNVITVINQLLMRNGTYGKEKYDELCTFRNAAIRQYRQKVILRKSQP